MRPATRARALKSVEQVRARVRADPAATIPLDDVAAEVGVSPIRLHVLFAELHGETFGAFVRRTRIELACGLMRAFPDWSCTRVAHEAGFSDSANFTRTFKRAFGLAPSRWDRVAPLNRLGKSDKKRQAADDESAMISEIGFASAPELRDFPVEIRRLPGMRLAVMEVRQAHVADNLSAAFDCMDAWLDARRQHRPERAMIGLSYDSNLDTPATQIRYELAHEVDETLAGDARMLIRETPAFTAAVLPCRGGARDFIAAWDHLLRRFLPASGWRPGRTPAMERYHNDPRRHAMAYWDMDCIQPIKRDGEEET